MALYIFRFSIHEEEEHSEEPPKKIEEIP